MSRGESGGGRGCAARGPARSREELTGLPPAPTSREAGWAFQRPGSWVTSGLKPLDQVPGQTGPPGLREGEAAAGWPRLRATAQETASSSLRSLMGITQRRKKTPAQRSGRRGDARGRRDLRQDDAARARRLAASEPRKRRKATGRGELGPGWTLSPELYLRSCREHGQRVTCHHDQVAQKNH